MTATQTPWVNRLMQAPLHRFAHLWEITRKDGVVLRFTDHNEEIPHPNGGDPYSPVGGYEATALRRETGLRPHSISFLGAITSDSITEEDLQSGLYHEARVTEALVDWMYPFLGNITYVSTWITDVKNTGEVWEANIEGVQRFAQQPQGAFHGRDCRFDLGGAGCGTVRVNIYGTTASSACEVALVNTFVNPKARFTLRNDLPAGNPPPLGTDATYTGGKIIWLTGSNAGTASYIQTYSTTGGITGNQGNDIGEFTLWFNTAFNIVAGDKCILFEDCKGVSGSGRGGLGGVQIEEKTWGQISPLEVSILGNDDRTRFQVDRDSGVPNAPWASSESSYINGRILWQTGDNAGRVSEILDYDDLTGSADNTGTFILAEPTPYQIQVGDSCVIQGGCPYTEDACRTIYHNKMNFGGKDLTPGPNRANQTPRL